MGETKRELCRCHHIVINLCLGGAGTTVMERRIDVAFGAMCVTHGSSLPLILLTACSPLHTYGCNIQHDDIFSLFELSPMRRVGVRGAGCISILGT